VTLRTAVEYVAAVYGLIWVAICAYAILIGRKLGRMTVELDRLERELDARPAAPATPERAPERVP